MSIYFYYIIKYKNIKKVTKPNRVYESGYRATDVDPICHGLNIFLKNIILKFF
jgi:hypothetical protein